jgi:hypothetical protein
MWPDFIDWIQFAHTGEPPGPVVFYLKSALYFRREIYAAKVELDKPFEVKPPLPSLSPPLISVDWLLPTAVGRLNSDRDR